MEKVHSFFNNVIHNNNVEAKEDFESILKSKIMQSIEDKKREMSNTLFQNNLDKNDEN